MLYDISKEPQPLESSTSPLLAQVCRHTLTMTGLYIH